MLNNTNTKLNTIISFLLECLENRITAEEFSWLNQKIVEISNNSATKNIFANYSAVPRFIGKEKLDPSAAELTTANKLVTGWYPINWHIDQVGRTLLLLSFPSSNVARYIATLEQIITAADMGEAIAFYQALPLLPHPELFRLRAAEGIRTNMTSVFNAVAHYNPYPATYLDNLAWNQMVLKALFVESPLHLIYGLESRNNQQLSQMLIDYARERLTANRTVSSELWELVKPFQADVAAKLQVV